MSELLPGREEEPVPEGYETWSPSMGRGAKVFAVVVLAVVFAGLAVMVLMVFS